MKLYYTPYTCSFAPHIVARELGLPLELRRVRLGPDARVLAEDRDYRELSPLGYVPLLELDDGRLLREGVAILRYLGDQDPAAGLSAPLGSFERAEQDQWLTYINSELHKTFSPWLFHPEYGEASVRVASERLQPRLALVDQHLEGREFLGERFGIADAYLYTVAGWTKLLKIDLAPYPHLAAYLARLDQRPSIREALRAEREDAKP